MVRSILILAVWFAIEQGPLVGSPAGSGGSSGIRPEQVIREGFPDPELRKGHPEQPTGEPFHVGQSPFRPRNYWLAPLGSLFLPGLDQWVEEQRPYGAIYSSSAIVGWGLGLSNLEALRRERREEAYRGLSRDAKANRQIHGLRERRANLGFQLAFASGSLSAYHAFHTAAASRKHLGQFAFIEESESPAELALAPFRFSYLKRKSTYIPMAVIGGFYFLVATADYSHDPQWQRDGLDGGDLFFASSHSYLAGVHEEALFRGWLLPALRQDTGDDFISNGLTSLIFAAGHLGTVERPIVQLALGYHLGFVTQKNGYRIGESIFIHTWWDVLAFLSAYQVKRREPPVFWLPPFQMAF